MHFHFLEIYECVYTNKTKPDRSTLPCDLPYSWNARAAYEIVLAQAKKYPSKEFLNTAQE